MIIKMGKSLIKAAENVGLKINEEKTEYMVVSRRNGNQIQEEFIEVEEYKFKRVDQFKYLGSIITQDNDIKTEISMRLQSANKCFFGLSKIFRSRAISKNLKVRMYLTLTLNLDSYRTVVHFLRREKAEFHKYQLNEDKPTRVVLRNLHPSTPTELIKSELEVRLFEVRQVTQVLHRINKHPLPLFFIDLEPTDFSQGIYQLDSLLHTKIKIEEPHKPKIISQCQNCQAYG
ncbi:hypothetical protein QTP88_026430 [Uroleucon formosanum]